MSAEFGVRSAEFSSCAPYAFGYPHWVKPNRRAQSLFLCAALFILSVASLRAGPSRGLEITNPTGLEAGRELAAQLLSLRPPEEGSWTGNFYIYGRGRKISPIPVECKTHLTETNWSVEYLTKATDTIGAEKLTITFTANQPNQYLYARAPSPEAPLGVATNLSGAQADIPLAGTDFLLSDLGYEFYHWPVQNRQRDYNQKLRPCYVLESINPHPAPGGYARVVTWVEMESNEPLRAEAYDAKGDRIKRFELGSVDKVHGHYEVKDIKMFNEQSHSRTELKFDSRNQ
jgi:hypothetical protein